MQDKCYTMYAKVSKKKVQIYLCLLKMSVLIATIDRYACFIADMCLKRSIALRIIE